MSATSPRARLRRVETRMLAPLIITGLPCAQATSLSSLPRPLWLGLRRFRRWPALNMDALVTAVEAAPKLGVDRHLIYVWRGLGKVAPKGRRGRSPLYRWGDLLAVESQTRRDDPAGQRRTA